MLYSFLKCAAIGPSLAKRKNNNNNRYSQHIFSTGVLNVLQQVLAPRADIDLWCWISQMYWYGPLACTLLRLHAKSSHCITACKHSSPGHGFSLHQAWNMSSALSVKCFCMNPGLRLARYDSASQKMPLGHDQ